METSSDRPTAPDRVTGPLAWWERGGLALLVLILVVFGVLVEYRSALLSRRMGDLGCYLRGAWAARTGADMYAVVDDNLWHYNYPPLYAILLMPLADPPAGEDGAGYVPYAVSVGLFYVLNVAFLLWAAHVLATALERAAADPGHRQQPLFCRRWWALRLWPIWLCLPPAGQTTMRGQVNHLVLALLCLFLADVLRRRSMRAGVFLALAICIKVIPAYLLVYPLWRRDGRALAGCAAGLVVGLLAVPLAVMGPARTAHQYERYAQVLFGPLLHVNDDESRKDELLGANATDSVGIKHILHNWSNFRRAGRPQEYTATVEWTYRLLGVLLTLVTLWPRVRSGPRAGWQTAQQFAALVFLMVAFSPISHLHYLIFSLPLVMTVIARRWEGRADLGLGLGLTVALGVFVLCNTVPSLPGLDRLKDLCVPMLGALPLWVWAVAQLWTARAAVSPVAVGVRSAEPPRLAA